MKTESSTIEKTDIYDVKIIREDFPILKKLIHGKPLCYLDNAATSQKPQVVVDALDNFYLSQNANVHRGVHHLSEVSSKAFEDARIKIKEFVNASSEKEIIFTHGTTEAINLVAYSFGRKNINAGDEIIISHMEHHSNIVPWQILCEEKKAMLKLMFKNLIVISLPSPVIRFMDQPESEFFTVKKTCLMKCRRFLVVVT